VPVIENKPMVINLGDTCSNSFNSKHFAISKPSNNAISPIEQELMAPVAPINPYYNSTMPTMQNCQNPSLLTNNINLLYNPQTSNVSNNNFISNANTQSSTTPFMQSPQILNNPLLPLPSNSNTDHYRYDLSPPSTLKDYHSLCYHFRSGRSFKCKNGKNCTYRHYDFEKGADVVTAWNVNAAKKQTLNAKDLAKAQKLKTSIEAQFKWLLNDKHPMHHTLNEQKEQEIEKKEKKKEKNVGADYQTVIAMLTPFNNERNETLDYYSIGRVAVQYLLSMQQKK